jgi:hypothetical protein
MYDEQKFTKRRPLLSPRNKHFNMTYFLAVLKIYIKFQHSDSEL